MVDTSYSVGGLPRCPSKEYRLTLERQLHNVPWQAILCSSQPGRLYGKDSGPTDCTRSSGRREVRPPSLCRGCAEGTFILERELECGKTGGAASLHGWRLQMRPLRIATVLVTLFISTAAWAGQIYVACDLEDVNGYGIYSGLTRFEFQEQDPYWVYIGVSYGVVGT